MPKPCTCTIGVRAGSPPANERWNIGRPSTITHPGTSGEVTRRGTYQVWTTRPRPQRMSVAELTLAVVQPAQQLVAHDVAEQRLVCIDFSVADHDRVALVHHLTVDHARVVRCSRTAPAARLDLHRQALVGDLQHPLRAVEQLAAEVGDEPEREDVDTQIV